ncbi:hypothetical protein BUALT_Bualt06G0040200 [Buddleja alternifolia]|uniref:FAD/NAD(P)-binding domain-containing protein n=1 Tax=Buddleja alternifolia TaxID=168488 RepID=A0AAV6XKZ6_9LAMI|nr:hypothetical protein BUALT_Bualt06G0040200 [Buddleja alternifolia]
MEKLVRLAEHRAQDHVVAQRLKHGKARHAKATLDSIPSGDSLLVFVDAAFKDGNMCSGMEVRDSNGTIIFAAAKTNFALDARDTELQAIKDACSWMEKIQFGKICFVNGCLGAIQGILKVDEVVDWRYESLTLDIRKCFGFKPGWSLHFVNRDCNFIAHSICQWGFVRSWSGPIPLNILPNEVFCNEVVEKKRVVVIGGGVAGSHIANTLQHHAHVFLIDLKEYFDIPWTDLRSMVEPSFANRTLINHTEYLPNARIITSAATNITQNEVMTAQGRLVAYDYLVIATGHDYNDPRTKNEKLSYFQAENEKIKSANSILIIGGGPTGVELAAEIIVDFPDKKVTLVHRGSRLLEFIGEKAGKSALDWLTSKKVEVILGQSVKLNPESDGVYETSGGETITADCHFLCTGYPIGSSWLKETCLKDSLDTHGKLMVDTKLRVKGHNNIFAIGDITDIPELKQGYLAQKHASVAAKNLKLLMRGESETKLSSYKPASPIALVSLGRRDGLAQIMCITTVGRIAGMIKSGDLFVGMTRKQLGLKSNP